MELIRWYFGSINERNHTKPRFTRLEICELSSKLDELCDDICKKTGAKMHKFSGGITYPK